MLIVVTVFSSAPQTILILYAMRRCPATASDVIDMPGRGTVSFLIVGNIAAWIQRTMQVGDKRYSIYSRNVGHFREMFVHTFLLTDLGSLNTYTISEMAALFSLFTDVRLY